MKKKILALKYEYQCRYVGPDSSAHDYTAIEILDKVLGMMMSYPEWLEKTLRNRSILDDAEEATGLESTKRYGAYGVKLSQHPDWGKIKIKGYFEDWDKKYGKTRTHLPTT